MKYLLLLTVFGGEPQFVFEETPVFQIVQVERCTPKKRQLIFVAKDCPHCPKLSASGEMSVELKELVKRRYTVGSTQVNHFQIIYREAHPKEFQLYQVESWPTYIVVEQGKALRRKVGRLTTDQMEELYLGPKPPPPSRPMLLPSVIRGRTTWTWPGGTQQSLREHLIQVHRIDPTGMTMAEMRAVHDAAHNFPR